MTEQDNVALERKQWFAHFPEGSIEFTVVTRVLALLLLASLIVLPAAQRPAALVPLAGMIWLDYVIVIWWLVQMAFDVEDIFGDAPLPASNARRRRMLTALKIVLPSLPLLALLAPWPALLIKLSATRAATMRIMVPVLLVAFCIFTVLAMKTIRQSSLGRGIWSITLLIPVLHWFAVHRVLHTMAGRLTGPATERGLAISQPRTLGSNVLLVIALLCWAAWIALIWTGGAGIGLRAIEGLSLFVGALFAVVDIATMEGLQRQFVALLRKS